MAPLSWLVSIPMPARPAITFADTWWASSAPSTETPTEPPIDRKNATTELAAPMSACAVLFCTARTRFCMVAPRPRPSTVMNTPIHTSEVVASMVPSSPIPTTTSAMPRDEVALPQPGLADDPTGDDARDQQAADHRDRHQAGLGGRHPAGALEVLAEVDGRAEHREPDQHGGGGRQRGGPVPEQPHRDHRVGGEPGLDQDRGGQDDQPGRHHERRSAGDTQSNWLPASETQTSRMLTPATISVAPR